MKKAVILPVFIGSFCLLAACASSPEKLQRATANHIGGITSSDVSVSDIDQGMTAVTWKAKTSNAAYYCEADDMVREVNCVKDK